MQVINKQDIDLALYSITSLETSKVSELESYDSRVVFKKIYLLVSSSLPWKWETLEVTEINQNTVSITYVLYYEDLD